jgi:hypothetical protein
MSISLLLAEKGPSSNVDDVINILEWAVGSGKWEAEASDFNHAAPMNSPQENNRT